MEARVAKLESDVGHIEDNIGEIRKDIRELRNWLLAGGIGGFLILMGALATGYLRLADKIEDASATHEITLKEIRDRLPSSPTSVPARKP